MSIILKPDGDSALQVGNANADAYVQGHGNTKFAFLRDEDLAVTKAFVLIDLSDTTNFPHTLTGRIRLYSLTITTEKEADGEYRIFIGCITEVDATNGSTSWIQIIDLKVLENPTDSTDRQVMQFSWPGGIDLEVVSEAFVNVVSAEGQSGNVAWRTDTPLDSPFGATASAPGAGDLVVYVEETDDVGTISFSILAEYITEAATV